MIRETHCYTLQFANNHFLDVTEADAKKIEWLQQKISESTQIIFRCECAREIFTIAFAVASEHKSLKQAIQLTQLRDPWLLEHLETAINYLYPSKGKKIFNSLCKQYAYNMSVQEAKFLVKEEQERILEQKLFPLPSFERMKEKKLIYLSTDDAEANKLAIALDQFNPMKIASEQKNEESPDISQETIDQKFGFWSSIFRQKKRSPLCQQSAAQHINSNDGEIWWKARKADKIIKSYQKGISEVLEQIGVDMSNTDLLSYLIGPKHFFFSHYGLLAGNDKPTQLFYHHSNYQNTCKYYKKKDSDCPTVKNSSLCESNSASLEKKIRYDIQRVRYDEDRDVYYSFSTKLPSQIFKKRFKKTQTLQPMRLHEQPNEKHIPRTLALAFKRFKQILYFSNEAESCAYFQKISELAEEARQWKEKILNASIDVSEEQLQLWKQYRDEAKNKLHQSQKEWMKIKSSPEVLQRAISFIQDSNPWIQAQAKRAECDLAFYKNTIADALQTSGANIKRSDLLQYIIGPKCFLFFHYQLITGVSSRKDYPFTSKSEKGGPYTYLLDNDDAYALEDEIRQDLEEATKGIQLPPRLINRN